MAREVHFILSTVKRFEKATNASKRNFPFGASPPKKEKFRGIQKIHKLTSKHCFSFRFEKEKQHF